MTTGQHSTTWVTEIMRERLKQSSLIVLAVYSLATIAFALMGHFAVTIAATGTGLLTGAILLAMPRLPFRWSGGLVFLLWVAQVVSVQVARPVVGADTAANWMLLLLVGHSIGLLEKGWCLSGLTVAAGVLIANSDWQMSTVVPHLVSLSALIGISVLSWCSSGMFVRQMEQLRVLDAQRATELAEALAVTSKALDEREQMEADRERVLGQLMLSQRMEAVGRLASGIAHDMNNVLAGVVGMATLVRADVPPHVHDDLDAIIASGHRGAELTRSLLAFARHERMRDEQFELARIAEEVLLILQRTQPKTANCELRVSERPVVVGDPTLVTQALLNLCLNAVDAINSHGNVTITVDAVRLSSRDAEVYGLSEGHYASLAVSDDGVGIDEDTQARMFEPFFTTKALGQGTGLGLSMVYGTVRAHAGVVHAASKPGFGATFTMLMPALDGAVIDITGEPTLTGPRPGTGRSQVLIVDDDPMVLAISARLLGAAGFDSLQAANGAEGLAMFARDSEHIDAVILDMSMPVMGGAECFQRLREISPDVKVILTTGFVEPSQLATCAALSPHALLEKPVDPFTFIETVRSATVTVSRSNGRPEGTDSPRPVRGGSEVGEPRLRPNRSDVG